MELHAFHAEGLMAHSHDFSFGRFRGDLKAGRKARAIDNERMVSRRVEGIGQLPENRPAVMLYGRRLTVHEAHGSDDFSAKCDGQRLMTKADAQKRQASGEMLHGLDRDTRLVRRARSRRDNDAAGLEGLDLFDRNLIVAIDPYVLPQLAQILNEIVGERVVIIDHQQHGDQWSLWA